MQITERVFAYKQHELDDWRAGDRSLVPRFISNPQELHRNPSYSFGEIRTLLHYHQLEGWNGFNMFSLARQYPHSKRRAPGRRKVEELIPAHRLQRYRALLEQTMEVHGIGGEPDLFLYHDDGRFKFAEVKKGRDTLHAVQLARIAQILDALACEVDIVYLREEHRAYTPKTFAFDLTKHTGCRVL